MSTITTREAEQVAAANASGRQPSSSSTASGCSPRAGRLDAARRGEGVRRRRRRLARRRARLRARPTRTRTRSPAPRSPTSPTTSPRSSARLDRKPIVVGHSLRRSPRPDDRRPRPRRRHRRHRPGPEPRRPAAAVLGAQGVVPGARQPAQPRPHRHPHLRPVPLRLRQRGRPRTRRTVSTRRCTPRRRAARCSRPPPPTCSRGRSSRPTRTRARPDAGHLRREGQHRALLDGERGVQAAEQERRCHRDRRDPGVGHSLVIDSRLARGRRRGPRIPGDAGPPRLTSREGPRHRHRRPRARARAGPSSRDPAVSEVHAAPGNPGIAAVASCTRSTRWTEARSPTWRSAWGSTSSSSAPRPRWSPGVADAVRERGIAVFGPSRRGRPARGVQGLRQGRDGRGRGPDRAGLLVHHRRARSRRRSTSSGRRTSSRRTGSPRARASSSPRTDEVAVAARRWRASDGPGRGVPRRARGVAVRDHRRRDRLPDAAGPGLQADLRRRRRPEHRRHGRVHAARLGAGRAWWTRCMATVAQPTIDEMARRGTPFSGLLYVGLALTSRGTRVVEFNARWGDPETQPLLALLESPLSALFMGVGHRHAGRRRRRRSGRTAPRSRS